MEIKKLATAGTLESSDAFVTVEPNENGIELNLESVVINQFGEEIEALVYSVLDELDVKNVNISINDRGAVECVLRARIETAVMRGKE